MEFKNHQAIYMQIADFVLDNILSGSWKNGDRVQSVREMAATVEVNPNTVVRSYSYLQDMGILFNKRGIGYFVAEDALKRTREIRREAFLREELPSLFHAMELLDIKVDELPALYTRYSQQQSNGHSS